MSIFGQLDAETVTTNPFFVEEGEYTGEVTKAFYKTNRNDVRQLVIEYTINNEDSAFLDSKVSHYFDLPDKDMTLESMSLLPADEQKKIRKNMSNVKRTLCGNDGNPNHKGLGVSAADLNDPNWSPEIVVGTKVNFAVNNYGPTNQGVAIKWVNLAD